LHLVKAVNGVVRVKNQTLWRALLHHRRNNIWVSLVTL